MSTDYSNMHDGQKSFVDYWDEKDIASIESRDYESQVALYDTVLNANCHNISWGIYL